MHLLHLEVIAEMMQMKNQVIKRYSELKQLQTFEERFNYLKLNGLVGFDTFGFDRYLNQDFYKSSEWHSIRDFVIVRDNGCDMGLPGNEICGKIYVHHMNPITKDDIQNSSDILLNPEFLICVSFDTHNAIHYGDSSISNKNKLIERTANDMCPWKQ